MINLEWRVEKRKLSDLKVWEKNPRQISKEKYSKLKERITERGFHSTLTLDENNVVLSGNQRLRALIDLGWTEIDCEIPNRPLSEEERDKVGLESNINDGETDFDILANEFDMETLLDVGFDEEELLGSSEEKLTEKETELKPYKQAHILLSIDIDKLDSVVNILSQLKNIDGVEIEQSAN